MCASYNLRHKILHRKKESSDDHGVIKSDILEANTVGSTATAVNFEDPAAPELQTFNFDTGPLHSPGSLSEMRTEKAKAQQRR